LVLVVLELQVTVAVAMEVTLYFQQLLLLVAVLALV
jgi:hypothetical protein